MKPDIPAIVRTVIRLREHKDIYPSDTVQRAVSEWDRRSPEYDGDPADLMAEIMIALRVSRVDDD